MSKYRGYDWEKFPEFCDRMLQKHPTAEIIREFDELDDPIKFGVRPFIHCTPVDPEPDKNSPIFTNLNVPSPIRTYYEHKYVCIYELVGCVLIYRSNPI